MNENADEDFNPSSITASIEEDFRLLVESLSHEIGLIDDPESEVLAALWKTKFIAERGHRLSQELAKGLAGDNIA